MHERLPLQGPFFCVLPLVWYRWRPPDNFFSGFNSSPDKQYRAGGYCGFVLRRADYGRILWYD
jgi:hypothetical protein